MIVDPARDISRYLKDAGELGVRITTVYLTRSHADFVAGHMELARATNAAIVVNARASVLKRARRLAPVERVFGPPPG